MVQGSSRPGAYTAASGSTWGKVGRWAESPGPAKGAGTDKGKGREVGRQQASEGRWGGAAASAPVASKSASPSVPGASRSAIHAANTPLPTGPGPKSSYSRPIPPRAAPPLPPAATSVVPIATPIVHTRDSSVTRPLVGGVTPASNAVASGSKPITSTVSVPASPALASTSAVADTSIPNAPILFNQDAIMPFVRSQRMAEGGISFLYEPPNYQHSASIPLRYITTAFADDLTQQLAEPLKAMGQRVLRVSLVIIDACPYLQVLTSSATPPTAAGTGKEVVVEVKDEVGSQVDEIEEDELDEDGMDMDSDDLDGEPIVKEPSPRAPSPVVPVVENPPPVEVAPVLPSPVVESPPREPVAMQVVEPAVEPVVEEVGEEVEDDDSLEERIEVPLDCRGTSAEASKRRLAFKISQVKKAFASGKVVLSNSFENDQLVIQYVLDETPPFPVKVIKQVAEQDVAMEDVKPVLTPVRAVVPARAPTPEPPTRPPTLFPMGLAGSVADTVESKREVEEFIAAFFPLFDANRSSLIEFYTNHAKFSIRLIHKAPLRSSTPFPPFSQRLRDAANKDYVTEQPIFNALRKFPAGSHDLLKIQYDAKTLWQVKTCKKGKHPIALTCYGEFDEFPTHVVRSFTRTFILVPKVFSLGGAGCPLSYLIDSDQLTYRHYDPSAPYPISIAPPARAQTPPRMPTPVAVARAPVAVTPVAAAARAPSVAAPVAAPRIPVGPRQPVARPPVAAPRPTVATPIVLARGGPEKRPAPPPTPSPPESDSDDDIIIVDQAPPPKRRALPPTGPAADRSAAKVQGNEAGRSEKSLGKRRAVDPMDVDPDPIPAAVAAQLSPQAIEAMITRKVDEALASYRSRLDPSAAVANKRVVAPFEDMDQHPPAGPAPTPPRARAPPVAPAKKAVTVPTGPARKDTDGRLVIPGQSKSIGHGSNGVGNKMRYFIDAGPESCLLAMTTRSDILEWDESTHSSSVRKAYVDSGMNGYIDDYAWVENKGLIVVGFLGGDKSAGEKAIPLPKAQIVLMKKSGHRGKVTFAREPLAEKPHASGGVTSLAVVPANRLRFVTAGQDKSIYLWTRSKATQTIETVQLATDHTSRVLSMTVLSTKSWLVSGGEDKRVAVYDLHGQRTVWRRMLPARVTNVQSIPCDPNLILCRTGAISQQFSIFDLRLSSNTAPSFTFSLPNSPNNQSTSKAASSTLGRYHKGSWRQSLFATPDGDTGVLLWDIRRPNARDSSGITSQKLMGVGRGKVVETLWRGRDTIVVSDLSNFTVLSIH